MTKQNFSKLPWNKQFALNWKKMEPPVRPSQKEQKFYENWIVKILKTNPKAQILILGATPEFRDLLFKYKVQPICCDINPEAFETLKLLMKRKGKELFIHSDWLKLKGKGKFDLIMGHQIFNMIPRRKHELLAKKIASNLKSNGLFINSIFVRFKGKTLNIIDGFKRYRRLTEHQKEKVPFFATIYTEISVHCAQQKGDFYTPAQSRKEVEKLYTEKLISQQEKEKFFKIMSDSQLKVYLPFREEIEKIFRKYFYIPSVYEEPTKYYDSTYWPIYVLKKK